MTRPAVISDHPAILIVDDNPAALYIKSRILGKQGYRVIEASTGTDALTLAAAERPDLVLLDINLPDLNGFEVCRQLKTQSETQFIKVLQTSAAHIVAPDRVRGLEVGADAYLAEPAEEEELIGTVRALLKLARHERDNQRLIERLTESETRYRSLMERMPAAMYTIDREGRITFYNEEAAELWGRRPILGDNESRFCGSHKLLWPDGTPLPHDKTPMVDAVQDGTALHGQEVIIERSDGTRRHVIVHIDPLRNAEGHIVGAVNLFTDITERKQEEERRHESEERLRLALEGASMGSWDVDLRTGRAIWNRRHALIQGYEPDDQPHTLAQWRDRVHPDDLERVLIAVEEAKRGRSPFTVEHRLCLPLTNKVRWLSLHGRLFYDEKGEAVRISGVSLDITDRKESEEALRNAELRFQNMAHSAPVLIWQTDPSGVVFVNRHYLAFFGETFEGVAGMGWADYLHPQDKAAYIAAYRTAFERQTSYEFQCRFRRYDGEYRWLQNVGIPHYESERTFVGFMGCSVDVTDIKTAEQALQDSQARLRLAMQGAGLAAWEMDLQTGINRWDDRLLALLGVKTEKAREASARWPESIHPDDRDRVLKEFTAAGEGHGLFNSEFRVSHADGSIRWFAS